MRVEGLIGLLAGAMAIGVTPASAQRGVLPTTIIVGGAPMMSDRDIMENLSHSDEHRVFVGLLHTAGLADTLRQHGPYTVFAPTDAAFAALPAGELDQLRRPENKGSLVKLLEGHMVSGDYSTSRLRFLMRGGRGLAELEDLAEGKLAIGANGPSNLALHDGHGVLADVTLYDVKQANGVVFVIDRVLTPG